MWPAPSSAARITATWPSIIPLGAITSAPAFAWAIAMLGVPLERGVVVHVAVGADQSAVPVVGVLVEAVVGHEDERVADLVAQLAQRDLHHPVRVVGAGAAGVLVLGDAEQDHRGDAEARERADLLAEALLGVLEDAGHRTDRLRVADAGLHEERSDEIVDRQPRLGGQAAHRIGAAKPARPVLGEAHAQRLVLPPSARSARLIGRVGNL